LAKNSFACVHELSEKMKRVEVNKDVCVQWFEPVLANLALNFPKEFIRP
jgi:hypothetical protein